MFVHTRCRRGVTVVEVLIALIVLSIAALGSAATIAYSARQQFRAGTLRQAYEALRVQSEYLMAASCADLIGGQATINGVVVRWTVEQTTVLARVTVTAAHGGLTPALETEVWCE